MFSKATEYALRATIFIAKNSTIEKKIGIEEISKAINSPQYFTAKILQILTKQKVIFSSPGPHGGFYLSAKTKKKPIRTILKAMGENDVLEKCILGLKLCSEKSPCPLHEQYKVIKLQMIGLFEEKSIEVLACEVNSTYTLNM